MVFGRLSTTESARHARPPPPPHPASGPAPPAPPQMTRRTSTRHHQPSLVDAHSVHHARHHPYPEPQRRASQGHFPPPPYPHPAPHPSFARQPSHGYPPSPVHSPDTAPMSGGSAFGQINLLADVAAREAATEAAGLGVAAAATSMPSAPATRSASAARGEWAGERGLQAEERRRYHDAVKRATTEVSQDDGDLSDQG